MVGRICSGEGLKDTTGAVNYALGAGNFMNIVLIIQFVSMGLIFVCCCGVICCLAPIMAMMGGTAAMAAAASSRPVPAVESCCSTRRSAMRAADP